MDDRTKAQVKALADLVVAILTQAGRVDLAEKFVSLMNTESDEAMSAAYQSLPVADYKLVEHAQRAALARMGLWVMPGGQS